MPAGCDFICNNVNCLEYRAGFSITAPWPLAKIENILAAINEKMPSQTEYKEQLQKWRNEGRQFACLILPNVNNVPIAAYRVNMWDNEKRCIWNFDVEVKEGQTLEEAIAEIVPKQTENGTKLESFGEILKNQIKCPHCGVEMEQSRWFSNE